MIGKSLRERYSLVVLPPDRAVAALTGALGSLAKLVVQVRAQDASMIACLVVDADKPSVSFCKSIGFEMKPGGSGVFGLPGEAAAKIFPAPTAAQRAWLETPCGPKETKVLLVASGVALLSLETNDGKVTIVPGP